MTVDSKEDCKASCSHHYSQFPLQGKTMQSYLLVKFPVFLLDVNEGRRYTWKGIRAFTSVLSPQHNSNWESSCRLAFHWSSLSSEKTREEVAEKGFCNGCLSTLDAVPPIFKRAPSTAFLFVFLFQQKPLYATKLTDTKLLIMILIFP